MNRNDHNNKTDSLIEGGTLCFHCDLDIYNGAYASGSHVVGRINQKAEVFCCVACKAIAESIDALGLGQYYDYKDSDALSVEQIVNNTQSYQQRAAFTSFDEDSFERQHVIFSEEDSATASVTLYVESMHCAACTWLIEKCLLQEPGMQSVSVNLLEHTLVIHWLPAEVKLSQMCCRLQDIGYKPDVFTVSKIAETRLKENKNALKRLVVSAIVMMQVGMLSIALYSGEFQGIADEYRQLLRWASLLICMPCIAYSTQSFFLNAWRNLRSFSLGMDVPVALAIGLSFIASSKAVITNTGEIYFDSICMVTFFLLLGRFLEMKIRHYSGRRIDDLKSVLPLFVNQRKWDGSYQEVAIDDLKIGDIILVKPGETIPVDGEVLDGESKVSEAQLTGEFTPQDKKEGDNVLAGSTNYQNPMHIVAEALGAQLKIRAIEQLLPQSLSARTELSGWMNVFVMRFVSTVLFLALLTYIYWLNRDPQQAFWVAVSVLVVSCPCALALASPTVIASASWQLRKCGLLVKDPQAWDRAPKIKHVVWDKTGTLTTGRYCINEIRAVGALSEEACRWIASEMEYHSEHPISSAFVRAAFFSPNTAKAKRDAELLDNLSDIHVEQSAGLEAKMQGNIYRIGSVKFACELFSSTLHPEPDDSLGRIHSSESKGRPERINSLERISSPERINSLERIDSPEPSNHHKWILLADQSGPLCWFSIADSVRNDAKQTIERCKKLGFITHLLSGDNSGQALSVAQQLRFDAYQVNATPTEKLHYVQNLQKQNEGVLIVGDGLNDLPIMAAADVSLAMNNAADLTKNHASGILLSNNLNAVADFLNTTKRVKTKITQNILWALSYNALAIPFAAAGLVPPYIAAIGMSVSSLIVTLNAISIFKNGDKRETAKRSVIRGHNNLKNTEGGVNHA